MARIPKVGREKDPDLDRVRALGPDLVLANIEENRREVVEALRAAGVPVWVTYPRTIREAIAMVRELGVLTGSAAAAEAVARSIEEAGRTAAARLVGRRRARVFCPIWRGPYMTINRDTYVHDVLRAAGGDNVFADRPERYPAVTLEAVEAAQPDVILLPDEPFRFRAAHRADFAGLDVPAVRRGRLPLVDGKLLTWHGSRTREALERLPALLLDDGRGAASG